MFIRSAVLIGTEIVDCSVVVLPSLAHPFSVGIRGTKEQWPQFSDLQGANVMVQ